LGSRRIDDCVLRSASSRAYKTARNAIAIEIKAAQESADSAPMTSADSPSDKRPSVPTSGGAPIRFLSASWKLDIRVGQLLRYTRIEALPQLVNVLRGEMGIIDGEGRSPSFLE
jgi:Bacterial sugar transferase